MADMFAGYVRRIDFEPKQELLEYRIYAHVFLKSQDGNTEIDVYTDNPRFEAAFLTAYSVNQTTQPPQPPKRPRHVEVYYEEVAKTKKVIRITLDEAFV